MIDDRIISVAEYSLRDDVLVVPHVETHVELRGNGMADLLMRGMLDDLRARGRKILPLCHFAAGFIHDHPGDADLLA